MSQIVSLSKNNSLTNFGMTEEQTNCLAISRDFICAAKFPKCESSEILESPMCGFYCDLWVDRCPNEVDTELYKELNVCDKTSKSSMCTGAVDALYQQSLLLTTLLITAYLL